MRVTELQVENFKKIRFVRLNLRPGVNEISGPNAAGKSSTLDAVAVWLDGMKVAPAEPIRKGASRAVIRGRLGDMYLTRTLSRSKSGEVTQTLTLEPVGGKPGPTSQRYLSDLIGEHNLDPIDFIQLDKKGKFNALKAFVPGYDFERAQRDHDADYLRRTECNRLARESNAAASMISVPDGTPDEPIDESALVAELQKAGEQNAEIEARKGRRQKAADDIEAKRQKARELATEAEELRKRAQQLDAQAAQADKEANELEQRLQAAGPLPEPIDVSAITAKIAEARKTNEHVRRATERNRHLATAHKYEAESEQLTQSIDAREKAKRDAIAAAKLPVAGIEFGAGEILLNGVPFDQASTAQKLRVAIALIVARNPKLRLAWIRDGSLLDDSSYAEVQRLAEEYQCDILIETVRPIGKDAVLLENGEVKAAAEAEAGAA